MRQILLSVAFDLSQNSIVFKLPAPYFDKVTLDLKDFNLLCFYRFDTFNISRYFYLAMINNYKYIFGQIEQSIETETIFCDELG